MFPPKPTQNTNAHQRIFVPSIPCDSKYPMIGIIAIVIGILSTKAERIAVLQRTIRAVSIMFSSIPDVTRFARYSSTHAASNPHTRTKRELKKRKTESSIFLRYFCGLS